MSREKFYRVPDILDIIYEDVIHGLYSPTSNYSVHNRIKVAKFNLACDILINTTDDEEKIVNKLGFSNINEFRVLFKNYLGISPEKFRGRFNNIN